MSTGKAFTKKISKEGALSHGKAFTKKLSASGGLPKKSNVWQYDVEKIAAAQNEATPSYTEESAKLKSELAASLGSGNFDKDKSRELVESYAGVQFKIFDENLKKGYTSIKPVGENLSNLFKAHGYDFGELYPDLAENFATGNIEGYAYRNSESFKKKVDDNAEREARKDAELDYAVAINNQREHERAADELSTEKRRIESYSGGYGNWKGAISNEYDSERLEEVTTALSSERKAAADAASDKIRAEESLFAINTMLDVMKRPDFEENSKAARFDSNRDIYSLTPTEQAAYDITYGKNSYGQKVDIAEEYGLGEQEAKAFLYIFNTEGTKAAQRFLDRTKNTRGDIIAAKTYSRLQEWENGNPFYRAASAAEQGYHAFASGVEGLGQAGAGIIDTFTGNTEYFMPGVAQKTTHMNKSDSGLVGKLILGAVEGMPQVAGTAALGAINPVLGTAFLGGTAYGSSYADAINSGATRAQAIGMGVASAALEIALEKYIGNTIEGFGSSLSEKVGKGLSKTKIGQRLFSSFDDFAKVHPKGAIALATVGRMFGNSSSEFVEEYLSETASPLLRNLILGENNDFTLISPEQKEAGLIGFITGSVLEGVRGSITLSNLGTDYGIRTEAIKIMSDAKALSEYKAKFGSDAESANKARAYLLDSERFVASVAAISDYAKKGLSYEEAVNKAESLGIDIGGFEEFTKSAYELGRVTVTGVDSPMSHRITYNLIKDGEATSYIADKVTELDKSIPRDEVIHAINQSKNKMFMQKLSSSNLSDFDKANAIKRYTIKEKNLEMMYEMGRQGLSFDASMVTEVLSEADAEKAFIHGQNARQAILAEQSARADAEMAKVPAAPFESDDGDNLKGDTLDDSSIVLENDEASYPYDEKSVIDGYEKAVDNRILDFINRVRALKDERYRKTRKIEISDIKEGSKTAQDISSLVGFDVSGFSNVLTGNALMHIDKDHGKNGQADKSMANDNDIARIGFVVDNYDSIELLRDKKGNVVTDKEHRNYDGTPSSVVKMSKKINGIYYVVEAVSNANAKKVYVKSAYISKNGSTSEMLNMPKNEPAAYVRKSPVQSDTADGSKPSPLNVSKDPQLTSETLYSQNATTDNIISDSSSDVNTTINSMGSNGTALYNRILEPIAKDTDTKASLEAYRNGFAHVYESGLKGVPYKRSKAQPLKLTQINAIYDAAKKDAATRANVKKKSDAKVHKDDFFYKAKVSKRTERILGGIARLVGRDIRFSDDVQGNARIDLTSGEIIISTKAKSGHTWAMIHEVYHALVVDSPAEAAVLKKTVLDIAKKNKAAFRKMLEKYESVYADELLDNGDGVKHSKAVDLSGNEYWHIDSDKDVFKNLSETKDLQNAAYNYILNGEKGERVTDIIDGEELQFRRVSATEYLYGTDSKTLDSDSYKQKMRMSPSILDLIENATITYDSPDIKNNKKFPDGFKNYQGRVGIDDKIFRYIVRVGKATNGKVFYDISLEVDDVKVHRANGTSLINKSSTSNNYYTQKNKNVNTTNEKHSKDLSVANVIFDKYGNLRQDAAEYITEEMVADLVGYTLSDPAILETLTGKQRSVFQKFVDRLISIFGDRNIKAAGEYLSNADADIKAIFKDVAKEADAIAEQFKAALEKSKTAEKKTVEKDDAIRNSISLIKGKNQDYGIGVYLDTDIFEGISPRGWGKVLSKFVYENLAGKDTLAYDNDGMPEVIHFAKKEDRVQKSGSKNYRRVLDELTYAKGNIEKLSVVHIDELLKTSEVVSTSDEKSHQWLDANGWEHRLTYVQDIYGRIYEATLNIGKDRNGRKVLYSVSNVKKVDEVPVSSKSDAQRDWTLSANSKNNYTQKNGNVNRNSKELFADDRTMTAEAEKNTVEKDGVSNGRWSKDITASDDQASIKNQLKLHLDLLNSLEPVANIEYKSVSNRKELKDRIVVAFKKLGFVVERQSFGSVIIDESQINEAAKYLNNDAEYAAMYAVPKVLKRGVEITNRKKHKDRTYNTITFAAPVIINGVRGNVAVVVKKTKGNRYKTHRIVAPDGSEFVFNEKIKAEATVGGMTDIATGEGLPITSTFDNSISKDNGNVNRNSKELFADDRTMTAEEIENDEIEQMIQTIKSSDDLSDADVQAIREELRESRRLRREKLLAEITSRNLERWGADIGRVKDVPKMSIDEAVKRVKESFGITITDAKDASVAGSAVSSYNKTTRTIRTKFKSDLPSICYALGYHIDNTLGVVDRVIEQTERVRETSKDALGEWEQELRRLSNYEGDDSRKAIKEGFSEFIREYLVSKNLAHDDAPVFYNEFEAMLKEDVELQKAVETSAEVVHGYFAQSAEQRGSASIMTRAEWERLNKEKLGDRLKSGQTRLIQAITDSFYAIKAVEKSHGVFDLTTSDTGYVKASMTRTSKSRAARIIMDAFYDADGNRIGDSFLDIIKPLGKESSKKMEDFGNYLSFVHAIEWIEPNDLKGKKTTSGKDIYNAKAKGYVFKDATLNDANELRRIIASMEERYPDFKAIAKKVYEYQESLVKYYLIPSGALSQDQAETFRAQYPHYVPFNRFNTVFGDATGKRNRSLFANLRNPIQKADGGDAPIRNPIESIINSTYAAVDFYDKQATMASITNEFCGMNAIPGVMSRIYSAEQLQELEDKGQNPFVVEKSIVGEKIAEYRAINEQINKTSVKEKTTPVRTSNAFISAVKDVLLDSDEEAKAKAEKGKSIKVFSHTPQVILENVEGSRDLPIAMNYTKIYLSARENGVIDGNYHGLGKELITFLPKILKDPDVILEMDNGRLNLISTVEMGEKNFFVVSLELDTHKEVDNQYLDCNVVVSSFDAGDKYLFKNLIPKHAVSVKYEKEGLPQVNPQLHDSLAIINGKPSSVNSISQSSENVNIGFNEDRNASFSPVADKEKGIVYRWVNGEKWFYQVYNRDLFNALSSLDVEQLTKGWRFVNTLSNFLKRTMTMWSPIFFTGNAIKDFQSFKKNTVTNAGVLGSLAMYVSSAKSMLAKDEYFRLYKALGGMDSTRLNADEDTIRKAIRSGVRKNTRLFHSEYVFDAIFRLDFKRLKKFKEYIAPGLWDYSKHEFFKRIDIFRNAINAFFAANDFIETLPRLAEFKNSMNMTESKGDTQLAFYRSQDVTTDFSRKGTKGRKINAIFLFSNANLQGIDKSIRTYTESGYTRKNAKGELSKSNVAKKIVSNLTFDLIMTALIAFLHRDEEDREEYRRLSDFTKNNYYCFHVGDGNFIKIPKGENSSLPQTLSQRLWDASQGDDIDLSELGGYIWDCFFPDFLPNAADVITADSIEGSLKAAANAPLNKMPTSVFTDVLLNRDYKGDEIVPDYMGNYENNYEKYTGSTSKLSVDLAKNIYASTGRDISPMSLDHFFGAAGWYGTFATKMMPSVNDGGDVDIREMLWNAFGLGRKFTADARYSTDLLNDFYNERDKLSGKSKVKPTAENLMKNEKYQVMSSFMASFNKQSRNGSEEQQRLDRRMLQMILEGFDDSNYTEGEEYVMKLYDTTKNDKVFEASFPNATFTANVKVGKKKVKKEVSLDSNVYAEFCADISSMREKVRLLIRGMGLDDVTAASLLEGAYDDINTDIKAKYAERYGKDPIAVKDTGEKTEVGKQDQNAFDKDYEDALNNIIYGE